MKWCNQCQTNQPLENFYNSKDTKDKLVNRCKECCRNYYIKNKTSIQARYKYNLTHKKQGERNGIRIIYSFK